MPVPPCAGYHRRPLALRDPESLRRLSDDRQLRFELPDSLAGSAQLCRTREGVNAWIDPETGGLVVDVERLTFTGGIEIRIESETVTCADDMSHPARVAEGARR
ncbi:hypothetical protein [Prescottella equi]|uniref:hypothetical protein n=1 Tax=Rhodococcus hoagii TaxID=43767 RepID=UPI0012F9D035|nr:hypothetical protein [Prescottella equi]